MINLVKISNSYVCYFVPDDIKCTIGGCRLTMKDNICYLSNLSIMPCSRNKGNGQKFLTELFAKIKELDYKKISLCVEHINRRALHIYEKLGFVKTSESEDPSSFVKSNDRIENMRIFHMELSL